MEGGKAASDALYHLIMAGVSQGSWNSHLHQKEGPGVPSAPSPYLYPLHIIGMGSPWPPSPPRTSGVRRWLLACEPIAIRLRNRPGAFPTGSCGSAPAELNCRSVRQGEFGNVVVNP